MTGPTNARKAVANASMEAARLHARQGTSFDRPVDIFRTVQNLGLWLTAEPLGNLFGFYLRDGSAAGVVLNSNHPEDLQRYTCAHELGHYILGHESHLDDSGDVTAADRIHASVRERAAQTFAGNYLMPLGLVNRVVRNLGLAGQPLSDVDIYQISRDLEVSYTAAVWRLFSLDRLGRATAIAYAKSGAASAKLALRGEPPSGSARGDLFIVGAPKLGNMVTCRVGDEIRLRLPENRSTGYTWRVEPNGRIGVRPPGVVWVGRDAVTTSDPPTTPINVGAVTTLDDVVRIGDASSIGGSQMVGQTVSPRSISVEPVGAEGRSDLVVHAQSSGSAHLLLTLRRGMGREAPVETADLTIRVRPAKSLDGFAPKQPAAHAKRLVAA